MPPTSDTPHRCAVLVVDDDPEVREVLGIALAEEGYAVAGAANGREALMHLRSTADTCMIVLDLGLPQMDGERFRAAQLRDRSLAWIPVVVATGDPEAARHAEALGARAYVTKPIDVDRLKAALRDIGCRHAPRPTHQSVLERLMHAATRR